MNASNRTGKTLHTPVFLKEVLEGLKAEELAHLQPQSRLLDATVGLGGHSLEFVKRGWYVVGIDADKETLEIAGTRIKSACPAAFLEGKDSFDSCFRLINSNFSLLKKIDKETSLGKFDAIIFDLGVSTPQLTSPHRGFSFVNPDAPLDMRISEDKQGVMARDLLNALPKPKLMELFQAVLVYPEAKKLTEIIISHRQSEPIRKVGDFLALIKKAGIRDSGKNNATRAFLALRIATNSEIEILAESIHDAYFFLKKSGRMAVISFHSGEDRVVKNLFKEFKEQQKGKVVVNGQKPTASEVEANPSARSAILRIIEKI